ncbi:MAG: WxL protein peptidoglycan domain-containing protein, partial [Gaiellaceae bacterium]
MRHCRVILLITVAAGALVLAQTAVAGTPSFALRPLTYDPAVPATKSYFVLAARAGSVIRDKVRIVNVGTAPGTVKLYAVDATTGQTSGTVYLGASSPRRGVGRWVVLNDTQLTLQPNQSRVVSFTVRVPAGSRSGDHVGGIVAENRLLSKASGAASSIQIRIRHLTVAAVVVRIPGAAAPVLSIGRVVASGGHGYQFVRLYVSNRGNVMIKPTGSLVLRDGSGKTVLSKPLQFDTLVPDTNIAYPVSVPKALQPGRYTAAVRLSYGNRVLVNGQGLGGPR